MGTKCPRLHRSIRLRQRFLGRARASLFELESEDGLSVVRTAAEIEGCLGNGTVAAILHFEGAENWPRPWRAQIVFYGKGLRSWGSVWS